MNKKVSLNKGKKFSTKTLKRMRIAHLGKKMSLKTRKKISNALNGRKFSTETRRKMSESGKLKVFSVRHRRNISVALVGRIGPMAGKKHSFRTRKKMSESQKGEKHYNFGKHLSTKHRRKISETRILMHIKVSKKTRNKLSEAGRGRRHSVETRKKMSLSQIKIREKHWRWKGGITPINHKVRQSLEYKLCREACFKRDNWTCVLCKKRGGKLNADHIKSFSQYPEFRFELSNLRTLCVPCHKKTPNYGRRKSVLIDT